MPTPVIVREALCVIDADRESVASFVMLKLDDGDNIWLIDAELFIVVVAEKLDNGLEGEALEDGADEVVAVGEAVTTEESDLD